MRPAGVYRRDIRTGPACRPGYPVSTAMWPRATRLDACTRHCWPSRPSRKLSTVLAGLTSTADLQRGVRTYNVFDYARRPWLYRGNWEGLWRSWTGGQNWKASWPQPTSNRGIRHSSRTGPGRYRTDWWPAPGDCTWQPDAWKWESLETAF